MNIPISRQHEFDHISMKMSGNSFDLKPTTFQAIIPQIASELTPTHHTNMNSKFDGPYSNEQSF